MEELKIKLNELLEELSRKFGDIIDEHDTLKNIIAWNEPPVILDKLNEDDVAEWLDGQYGWVVVNTDDKRALREWYNDLKDRFENGSAELTTDASAFPWKKDCINKINELANQVGWQGLLTKLESL
jgi:hypothetical protein